MKARFSGIVVGVFALGITVGAFAAKKGLDPATYHTKSKKEAAAALLEIAKKQAENGSWENIAVGRVYYAGGMKSEGQTIFDSVTGRKKAEGSDWMRVGRAYYDAGDWAKAKEAFDKALSMSKKDAPWLAEVGAYYNLKGDRKTAEEMFDKAFAIESGEVWITTNVAGSYLGVEPLR
jgi:tetratricopeptide (TPR) repeat protein